MPSGLRGYNVYRNGVRQNTSPVTELGSVTSAGWVKADPTVFPEVTGDTGEAVIVYKHTGTSSTSTLLSYHDSPTYQFVIPNGSDIRVIWPTDGFIRF
ncbi:hypothetical protein SEA_SIBS6_34 [Mycobacterium phage Sibs6]|nr:hypothetical protein SEA_SIBS6_34 [Mycobacterium phage Sibs6]